MRHFRNGIFVLGMLFADAGGAASGAAGGAGAGGDAAAAAGAAAGGAAAGAAGAAGAAAGANGAWSFPTDKAFSEYLPEAYRNDPSFRDIKSFDGLASSFVSAQKMLGGDKSKIIQVPGNDDAEGWNKTYGALGRPETADKYQIPQRGDGKGYSDADVAFQKSVMPVLHKAGLTQRQINEIIPAWNALQDETVKTQDGATTKALNDATAALKTKYGAAYDDRLGLASGALAHYAQELKLGDQVMQALDRTKLGNEPALFELFSHLGAQLKEDGVLGKASGGAAGGVSPAEAKQQIAAMDADKEQFAILTDKKHPKHQELAERRRALFEQAYPPSQPTVL